MATTKNQPEEDLETRCYRYQKLDNLCEACGGYNYRKTCYTNEHGEDVYEGPIWEGDEYK